MTLPAEFPANREQWDHHKASYRQKLWTLLGELPPLFTPEAETLYIEQRDGYTLSRIQFENGAGAMVYGYLLLPDPLTTPVGAVLYHHYHGGKYWIGKDEVLEDPVSHQQRGVMLAKAGYAVLAIDSYGFGERQHQGPAGRREAGAATEQALFKHLLWNGSSLWGMIVRDDLLALNYLASRPEIDPARIAATGMSLGASRTTWLSALDERVKVTIPIAQMTRYRDYADQGDYSLHSFYYYLPGMLKSGIDMEIIASLTAPRTQLILIGDSDNLSPLSGIRTVDAVAKQVYGYYGTESAFETRLYAGLGHQFTQPMLTALMECLQRNL